MESRTPSMLIHIYAMESQTIQSELIEKNDESDIFFQLLCVWLAFTDAAVIILHNYTACTYNFFFKVTRQSV